MEQEYRKTKEEVDSEDVGIYPVEKDLVEDGTPACAENSCELIDKVLRGEYIEPPEDNREKYYYNSSGEMIDSYKDWELMDRLLNIDYDGVDFLGEEYYNDSPIIVMQQINNRIGTNHFLFKHSTPRFKEEREDGTYETNHKINVDIDINRLYKIPCRKTLKRIDELCFEIRDLLLQKPTNASKKE